MQQLYRASFQRIWNKLGADKLQAVTIHNLTNLLKEKNIPLDQVD